MATKPIVIIKLRIAVNETKNWKKGFTKIGFEICDSAKLKITVSLLVSKSFGLLRR